VSQVPAQTLLGRRAWRHRMSFVPGCVDHADLHVLIDQDGVSIRVGDHDVVVVLHDQPVLRLVSCERG
jgi:hypothetical protein